MQTEFTPEERESIKGATHIVIVRSDGVRIPLRSRDPDKIAARGWTISRVIPEGNGYRVALVRPRKDV